MKTAMMVLWGLGLSIVMISALSCSNQTNKSTGTGIAENKQMEIQTEPVATDLSDPAVRKCIDDGFIVQPVIENGVLVRHLCINPEIGLKCDVWDYFRKECSLTP